MSFLDILTEYKVPHATEGQHCRPGWVQFDCPFCGEDTGRYHMGYSIEFRYTNCWRCGSHSLFSTLIELLGLSTKEIKELISELPRTRTERKKIEGTLTLPDGAGRLLRPHKRYLRRRGFSPKELKTTWSIQGIGISATHSWRILIPVIWQGQVVSWTTRSVSENKDFDQRYLHAKPEQELLNRTETLYGEDFVRGSIVVCEGPFDAWKIGPGATALLGLNYSGIQIEKILRHPVRAICFDNEPVAQRKAKELTDLLSIYPGETYNVQLDSADAGSASVKEIRSIRRHFLDG